MWNNDLRMILDNMSMFTDMNYLKIEIPANIFSYYY